MKRLSWPLLLLVVACVTVEPAPNPPADTEAHPPPAAGPIHLTLVATNDLHGWAMGVTDRYGAAEIHRGGLATLAGYVKVLRAENPGGVVLVDAGDLFQGTLMSNITEGAVVIDAFNLLGYDAAAIGNHEFDYGPVGAVSVATQPGIDPFGALKARILQARFPLLSTNIYAGRRRPAPVVAARRRHRDHRAQGREDRHRGAHHAADADHHAAGQRGVAALRPLAPEALTAAKRLRERGAELVMAAGARRRQVRRLGQRPARPVELRHATPARSSR